MVFEMPWDEVQGWTMRLPDGGEKGGIIYVSPCGQEFKDASAAKQFDQHQRIQARMRRQEEEQRRQEERRQRESRKGKKSEGAEDAAAAKRHENEKENESPPPSTEPAAHAASQPAPERGAAAQLDARKKSPQAAKGVKSKRALKPSPRSAAARHSSWTDQNPGRSKQRLEELRKKRDELAPMGAAGLMNHIADIADEKAGGHRDAAMLRSLARHCRTRAGRGIAGVDDGDAVDSGGLPTDHPDLAQDAGTDTPSHEKGMASGESMMRAHRAVLTDPRLGGVQDECCGAVTVIVGAAVDMRIEVRCTQPSPSRCWIHRLTCSPRARWRCRRARRSGTTGCSTCWPVPRSTTSARTISSRR
eukprot:COSAG04_NODE_106_length_25980_cov_446.060160_2_plen_360_part_00